MPARLINTQRQETGSGHACLRRFHLHQNRECSDRPGRAEDLVVELLTLRKPVKVQVPTARNPLAHANLAVGIGWLAKQIHLSLAQSGRWHSNLCRQHRTNGCLEILA
jgi:hypothetical protein